MRHSLADNTGPKPMEGGGGVMEGLEIAISLEIGYCSIDNWSNVSQSVVGNFVENYVGNCRTLSEISPFLPPCLEMPEFGPAIMFELSYN